MEYPMKCLKCNEKFILDCSLEEYEKHLEKKKFKCPFCKSKRIERDWSKQEMSVIYKPGFGVTRTRKIDKNFGYENDPCKGDCNVGERFKDDKDVIDVEWAEDEKDS